MTAVRCRQPRRTTSRRRPPGSTASGTARPTSRSAPSRRRCPVAVPVVRRAVPRHDRGPWPERDLPPLVGVVGHDRQEPLLLAPQPRPGPGEEPAEQLVDPVAGELGVDPRLLGAAGRPSDAASASTAWMVVSWHCRRGPEAAGRVRRSGTRAPRGGGCVAQRLGDLGRSRRAARSSRRPTRARPARTPRPRRRPVARHARSRPPSGAPSPGARPGRARSSQDRSAPARTDRPGRRTATNPTIAARRPSRCCSGVRRVGISRAFHRGAAERPSFSASNLGR